MGAAPAGGAAVARPVQRARAWHVQRLWPAWLLALVACSAGQGEPDCGERARLRVEHQDRDELALEVCAEVAASEDERRRGLRGHAPLAPDEALLIALPRELDDICVVNGGVSFDIDAILARADGIIVAIERSIPAGDDTARCHDGIHWIAETAAGRAASAAPGDRLLIELAPVPPRELAPGARIQPAGDEARAPRWLASRIPGAGVACSMTWRTKDSFRGLPQIMQESPAGAP